MAVKTTRRARGTGAGRVAVFAEVDAEAKQKLEAMVAATGAPKWAILEALIDRAELDPTGRPVWWEEPDNHQEALDIPA
ncbi:hypothetical protein [Cellulomonas carbonis]|uniref:hypothetical protein n=1 Tax=Cellulomonas carbonis TaxID=1386092 RepID=UPI001663E6CA|nr:hypothetical protein [Cellulomonas carbonis]GGC17644.1 hypothetical protein GCM10010972_33650 [Cellulomonas carbonis]